jgi:hypothetical protein
MWGRSVRPWSLPARNAKTDEGTPRDEKAAMKFLFDKDTFSFGTLRSAGFAADGGAESGEVITNASHIVEGDETSWDQARKDTAQRVAEIGEQALASAHRAGAREAEFLARSALACSDDSLDEGWRVAALGERAPTDMTYSFPWMYEALASLAVDDFAEADVASQADATWPSRRGLSRPSAWHSNWTVN